MFFPWISSDNRPRPEWHCSSRGGLGPPPLRGGENSPGKLGDVGNIVRVTGDDLKVLGKEKLFTPWAIWRMDDHDNQTDADSLFRDKKIL